MKETKGGADVLDRQRRYAEEIRPLYVKEKRSDVKSLKRVNEHRQRRKHGRAGMTARS